MRVGGGTAELVHSGDGLQVVPGAHSQSKVKDGRQGCRGVQVTGDGFNPDIVGPFQDDTQKCEGSWQPHQL